MLLWASPAAAHPAPFSYLDLHLDSSGVTGTLVVHDLDAAHDLGVANADSLLDPATAARYRDALVALLSPRLSLTARRPPGDDHLGRDRRRAGSTEPAARLHRQQRPGRAASASTPTYFPYDPIHQTFINIYEDSALKLQAILDASHQDTSYYSGSTQGRWAVVKTFVLSGHRAHPDRPRSHPVPDRPAAARRNASAAGADRDGVHDRPQHHALAGGARHPVAVGAIHRAADRADDRRRRRRQPAGLAIANKRAG